MRIFLISVLAIFISSSVLAFECDFERVFEDNHSEYIFDDLMLELSLCGSSRSYAVAAMELAKRDLLNDSALQSLALNYRHQGFPISYQIGSEWNRKEVIHSNFKKNYHNVLKIGDGSGVYIRTMTIAGESFGIVATNQHVVEGLECNELSIENQEHDLECLDIINLGVKEIDISLIITRPVSSLKDLEISFKKVESRDYYTAGYGSYLNEKRVLKEDDSRMCQFLQSVEGVVRTGCDVSSGDSGSAVFLKESDKLYGLINSTYIYQFNYTDNELEAMISKESFQSILRNQSSQFIPFYAIRDNLKQISKNVNLKASLIISKLVNQ